MLGYLFLRAAPPPGLQTAAFSLHSRMVEKDKSSAVSSSSYKSTNPIMGELAMTSSKPMLLLFRRSVVSDSLQHHRPRHDRLLCPSLSPSLLKLISIESMMLSNHLTLCCPLLLQSSTFPHFRVYSNEFALCIM